METTLQRLWYEAGRLRSELSGARVQLAAARTKLEAVCTAMDNSPTRNSKRLLWFEKACASKAVEAALGLENMLLSCLDTYHQQIAAQQAAALNSMTGINAHYYGYLLQSTPAPVYMPRRTRFIQQPMPTIEHNRVEQVQEPSNDTPAQTEDTNDSSDPTNAKIEANQTSVRESSVETEQTDASDYIEIKTCFDGYNEAGHRLVVPRRTQSVVDFTDNEVDLDTVIPSEEHVLRRTASNPDISLDDA